MMTIAVCDDSAEEMRQITVLLETYKMLRQDVPLKITCFQQGRELLEDTAGNSYNLYLLDVLMPDMNGLALARELRSRGNGAPLVFLTNSPDFALEAFQVRAFSYLLKPITGEALFPLLDEIAARQSMPANILIRQPGGGCVCIPTRQIRYVEHDRHICLYHLLDGEIIKSKTMRVSFTTAAAELLAQPCFLMSHQSFIVNMTYVHQMNQTEFIMDDKTLIPISKHRMAHVKNGYLSFLSSRRR